MTRLYTSRVLSAASKTVNGEIMNRSIRHAVFMDRLATHEANEVIKFLNRRVLPDLDSQITQRLAGIKQRGFDLGPATTKRLKQLAGAVQQQTKMGMAVVNRRVQEKLYDIATNEAQWLKQLVQGAMPIDVVMQMPSVNVLQSLIREAPMHGKVMSQWWKSAEQSLNNRIIQQINVGIAQGQSVDQIAKRLVGTKAAGFKDGIFQGTRHHARAITRTAVNHVGSQARRAVAEANQDIIKAEKWVATLDARTSDICASLDGQQWKVGEGPYPPMHMQCRSLRVVVTKSWKELGLKDLKEPAPGTRFARKYPDGIKSAMRGEVPASMNYAQWLKTQPVNIQNHILGKGKATLFRRGKVPLSRFVSKDHHPLTLKQLQKLEKTGPVKPWPSVKPVKAVPPPAKPVVTVPKPTPKTRTAPTTPSTTTAKSTGDIEKYMASLKPDQREGLLSWVKGDHYAIRSAEIRKYNWVSAEQPELSKRMNRLARAMNEALDLAPKHKGVVYRGMRLTGVSNEVEMAAYKKFTTPGAEVTLSNTPAVQFTTSASVDKQVGSGFARVTRELKQSLDKSGVVKDGGQVVLEVHGYSGVNISKIAGSTQYGWEEEVLLRQGARYRVKSVNYGEKAKWKAVENGKVVTGETNMTRVVLEEIPVSTPRPRPSVTKPTPKPTPKPKPKATSRGPRIDPELTYPDGADTEVKRMFTNWSRNQGKPRNQSFWTSKLRKEGWTVKDGRLHQFRAPQTAVRPKLPVEKTPKVSKSPTLKKRTPVDRTDVALRKQHLTPEYRNLSDDKLLEAWKDMGDNRWKKNITDYFKARGFTITHGGRLQPLTAEAAQAVGMSPPVPGKAKEVAEKIGKYIDDALAKKTELKGLRSSLEEKIGSIRDRLSDDPRLMEFRTGTSSSYAKWKKYDRIMDDILKQDDGYNTTVKELMRVSEEQQGINKLIRQKVEEMLAVAPEERATLELSLDAGMSNKAVTQAKKAHSWLSKMVSKRGVDSHSGLHHIYVEQTSRNRAYCRGDTVHIPKSGGRASKTAIHEMGHTLEHQNHAWVKESKRYLRERAAGESAQKLSRLKPQNRYGNHEICYKDKFMDPYMGRIYSHMSTELTSMALEYMMNDPITLWQRDPELFKWLIKMLRGEF